MIKTLYQIGRVLGSNPRFTDYFKPYQNPFPKPEGQTVLRVVVEQGMPVNIIQEEFRMAYLEHYLFRKPAGSNGTFLTPSSYYYHSDKPKEQQESLSRFYDKLRRTIANNKKLFGPYLKEDVLKTHFNPLFEQVIEQGNLKTGNILVAFCFEGKWPGEIPEFRELLFAEAYDKYKQSKKASYVGYDHVCAVTHETVPEVWGKIDTLGFTVDDEAFLRGGFDNSDAWKMFPVSKEVVPILEGARALTLEKLRFNFAKLSYLIVPRFVGWSDDQIAEALGKLVRINEGEKTLDAQGEAIINTENLIKEIVEDDGLHRAGITFDFFFYQQQQAQFSVKLHLTDVMPSRLGQIKEVKDGVERCYKLLTDKNIAAKGKNEAKTIRYHLVLANLKDYFSDKIGKDVIMHPMFFKITEAIFYKQRFDEGIVVRAFMDKMVHAFKNYDSEPYAFYDHGYRTFLFWRYLTQLNIFHHQTPYNMDQQTVALNLDDYLAQHQEDALIQQYRPAFLAGCLVEKLLAIQRKQYGKNEPFRKYLHNLSLDPDRLRKIMLKWEEKMQEYVQAGYTKEYPSDISLRAVVLDGLKSIGNAQQANFSKTDFSYVFTLGIVMQKAFVVEASRNKKNQDTTVSEEV